MTRAACLSPSSGRCEKAAGGGHRFRCFEPEIGVKVKRMSASRSYYAAAVVGALLAAACSKKEATAPPHAPAPSGQRAAVPIGVRPTPEELRRQRYEAHWRQLPSFGNAAPPVVTTAAFPENFEDIHGAAVAAARFHVPISGKAAGPSVLRAQVLLDRVNYSVGAIDGEWGKNSEIAVFWFQKQHSLPPTGTLDEATYARLREAAGKEPPIATRRLSADDVAGPFVDLPDSVYEQAKLDCLCYESLQEKLAERFRTTTGVLSRLNPGVDLNTIRAGSELVTPNVKPRELDRVSRIVVSVEGTYLHAYDAEGKLMLHAPTSVGSEYDPSPTESLKIVATAHDPTFHYQPTLFAEVPDENAEALLQPGPNSPVGVVWMALSKEHYGIHGTSDPESIGYASSHGCIRLANWDARALSQAAGAGTQVEFADPR